jgi:hypothetical protein
MRNICHREVRLLAFCMFLISEQRVTTGDIQAFRIPERMPELPLDF